MLIEQLPTQIECPPCPEKKPWQPEILPDALCDCPVIPEPYFPAPIIHREIFVEDCFKGMLLNMTNQYHCENPPKACD